MAYNYTTGDGDRIFAPVFADVWETHLKKMNGSDVKVYVALLLHTTQHDRTWFMSIDEISEDAGVSRDTARLSKDRLVGSGLFEQSWRYRDEAGDYHLTDTRPPPRMQAKNVYKVNVKAASVDAENKSGEVSRGRKSASIDAGNKHLVGADNQQQTRTPTTQPPTEPLWASAPVADAPSPAPKKTQAHELPENWVPDAHVIEQMKRECPNIDLEAETRKFRDYWPSQPGAKSRKKDWNATWRNWIRNARPSTSSPQRAGQRRVSPEELFLNDMRNNQPQHANPTSQDWLGAPTMKGIDQ